MNPEDQAKIDAALLLLAKLDSAQPTTLILIGVIAVAMVLIISGSNTFTTLRMLGVQSQFINAMTVRSVVANEQIRQSTDTQTTAMRGQTDAISAMNATGIATGAAVGRVDRRTSLLLGLAEIMGVDIKNLAQHEISPTDATQEKVEAIADKPAGDTTAPPPVATTPKPGDEIQVTGTVTGTVALTADTPV